MRSHTHLQAHSIFLMNVHYVKQLEQLDEILVVSSQCEQTIAHVCLLKCGLAPCNSWIMWEFRFVNFSLSLSG